MMMLLWKEWRQQRWVLLCGCLCGLIPPLFELCWGLLTGRGVPVVDVGGPTVLWGGAFFAPILAIAATQADLGRDLPDFWQSRSVSPARLFLVKYAVAAAGLFVCFGVVVSPDLLTFHWHDGKLQFLPFGPVHAICLSLPLALMMLGLTVFLVVLTRDATKSMLLATWFGLLFCCLPFLLGGPAWINPVERAVRAREAVQIWQLMSHLPASLPPLQKVGILLTGASGLDTPRIHLAFLALTVGVSVCCLWLAMLAVRQRWVWRPGQKTLAWATGLSVAAIFAVSMRQVGQDMVPVTRHHGTLLRPEPANLRDVPRHVQDWAGKGFAAPTVVMPEQEAVCYGAGLMFRASVRFPDSTRKVIADDFCLSVYELPYDVQTGEITSSRISLTRFHRVSYPVEAGEVNPRSLILGCFARADRLYIAYQDFHPEDGAGSVLPKRRLATVRFLVVDVSDPAVPRRVREIDVGQRDDWGAFGCTADYGDVAYIGIGAHVPIISVAAPDEPRLVGDAGAGSPRGMGRLSLVVAGDRLVGFDRSTLVLLDLTDPVQPHLVFAGHLNDRLPERAYGIDGVVGQGDMLYITTATGLYCAKLVPRDSLGIPWDEFCRTSPLVPDGNPCILVPQVIGWRPVTPLERLAGRPSSGRPSMAWGRPNPLLLCHDKLIEAAGGFGVLVYDVSDPSRPRRIAHGDPGTFGSEIGIWDGLLCVQDTTGRLTFLDVPGRQEADESSPRRCDR
jgi:hypothetical protein